MSTPADGAAVRRRPVLVDGESLLAEFWELTPDRKRGTFNFNGYRPNYAFPVHVSNRVNRNPTSPAPGHSGQLPDYRDVEAKLQFSVRTKVAEGLFLPNADLWVAFTEHSLWQVYTSNVSRPFRATDYEPEVVYVVPTRIDLPLGWNVAMTGVGIAHQSNGQALPYSRSWNRVYALAGVEKGRFTLSARFDQRIRESNADDDNPDLMSYRGRVEFLGIWTAPDLQSLSALWRTNFNSRGSLQIDWTMPVRRKYPDGLRWYVQAFSGYGETLIDYNFRHTSIGAGVSLFGW